MSHKDRPQSYISKKEDNTFSNIYCDKLIEFLMRGKTVAQFCSSIGIARSTFEKWRKTKPNFADAYERAKTEKDAYWQQWVVDNLDNKDFNPEMLKKHFRHVVYWKDNEDSTKIEINNNKLDPDAEERLRALEKKYEKPY